MHHLRIVLLLLFGLNYFGGHSIAQPKTYSKKEITKLTDEAYQDLKDANFEKSLDISKLALRSSIDSNDLHIQRL
ncbi:hypothetical protein [Flavobacterium sp. LB2P6]|uniref:hypothetical protein n=1 Tax=Flavobacterium sp. LB2P6 TaxID=3401714 RepID=UPI003AAADF1F